MNRTIIELVGIQSSIGECIDEGRIKKSKISQWLDELNIVISRLINEEEE